MNSRETVIQTIRFESPGRLPFDFPEKYGTDFYFISMSPSPDDRPSVGRDEWGAIWENIGVSSLGEVKDFPLKDWENLDILIIPDIQNQKRWEELTDVREKAGDKFIVASGISLYERVHFIRGLENTWADIYNAPDRLCELIDILVAMNIYAIQRYASLGADGFIFADDWGLQDRLMIDPKKWREIWKPRYHRVFETAHQSGLLTFLHSCGYIVDILDDLIEIGLDVIQMDQQQNMGLELLGERFAGRITFWNPVDIQNTMVKGTVDDIRVYCRKMVKCLGTPEGGFMPRWYADPQGAGHRQEAIDAMCDEFLKIGNDYQQFFEE